jgi:ElaB/YqjD/DUF883 family membrane-anchored ribosome-binding protein
METKNRTEQNKPTGTETTGNNPGRPTGQSQFGSNPTGSNQPNQGQTNPGQSAQGATGSAARPARDLSAESTHDDSDISLAAQRGKEVLGQAKQTVNEAYEKTSKALNQSYEQAVDYGRDNPGKTALIAFGVGIGVGLWLANTATPRNRASRIVPPVMNAVSNIVSELFR